MLTDLLTGVPPGLAARMAEAAPAIGSGGAAPAPDPAAVADLLRPLLHMLSTDAPSAPATPWLFAACLAAGAAWLMAGTIRRRHHGTPTRDHRPPCPPFTTGHPPPNRQKQSLPPRAA
ncbi:MAG: hypothetical protein LBU75_16400 [Desulfovibrio sp.]|nr:hypothetical protein [Desulfovibrio sp.]